MIEHNKVAGCWGGVKTSSSYTTNNFLLSNIFKGDLMYKTI